MFFEVRIKDKEGKVKKVLNSQTLSNRYWNDFFASSTDLAPAKNTKGRGRKAKRKEPLQSNQETDEWVLEP
ncbi:MAG: hypothetical protein G3M78_03700 [Candidatus Nitrohelix vancouverensis]|uniref:Uncharacterized protein n=1 Tax=Candidatus Nitrohelix vancouverensis TaxID=2705534 RepID=A0A7T0C0Y6_9BACT|nr:MAG: hypothetical protein G3M78_03700 [Candidatus Nitrohelix vancouverensis]